MTPGDRSEGDPAVGARADAAPADPATAQGAPADPGPAQGAPADPATAQGAPVDGRPAEAPQAETASPEPTTFRRAPRWEAFLHRHRGLIGHLRTLALGLVLVGAWVAARIPHTSLGASGAYRFPRHMDEWVHWGRAAATYRQGTVAWTDPWAGGAGTMGSTLHGIPFYHEVGFHAYLAVLGKVTGLPFLPIFEYGAAAGLVLLVLAAYAVGQRYGYGLEAALFTALVPTTPRFLGPAFLVPITFSFLVLVPAVLVAWRRDSWAAPPLLLLLTLGVWTLHARAAAFLVLPVLLGAAARARDRPGLAAATAFAVLLPALAATPAFLDQAIAQTFREDRLPVDRTVFEGWGLATLVLFALGAGWAVAHARERKEPLLLAATSLVALLLVFSRPVLGQQVAGMYDRAHMLYFLTGAPVAGYGLRQLRRLDIDLPAPKPGDRAGRVATPVGLALAVVVASAGAAGAAEVHLEQPYYAVIGEEDWEAWAWMDRELPARHDRVLMVPWKALAFGAASQRHVVEHQHPGGDVSPDSLSLRTVYGSDVPMEELRDRGVEVVYTQGSLEADGLREVRAGVHLVEGS